MDLNWIQDFVCLGRTLNFTKAAEERYISQPALSRRIKSLENWLGVPLIQRSTYPVRLSEAGHQFLPVAQGITANLSDIRQNIRASETGKTAFQRFAVLHTISINFLTTKISELEQERPDLRVRVYSDVLNTCCELFAEGHCDFLLFYRHTDVTPVFDARQFTSKEIGVERLLPVAETRAAAAGNWDLSRTDSELIPYLSYDPSTFLGTVVDQTIGVRKPPLALRYMDALAESIKRRTLAGSGVSWLPEYSIHKELEQGQLVQVGGTEWQATLTLSLFCSLERLDSTGRFVWDNL